MRILVTGGLGFIGHNVVSMLEDLGHDVEIVDNMTGYGVIPKHELNFLIEDRSRLLSSICHIHSTSSRALEHIFNGFDPEIVIHLASAPRQPVVSNDPMTSAESMINGLINVCEMSKKYNVKKLVFVSSSMVYGNFQDDTKEDHICDPKGQYGILKLAGEMLVKDYASKSDFDYVVVRPSAVYGPRDVSDRLITKFFMAAMKDQPLSVHGADLKLDFTHVLDVAQGIVLAATNDQANNDTFNITRGKSHTILEAAELIVDIVGKGGIDMKSRNVEYPDRGMLNCDKAKHKLGYEGKIDIEEGFARYYEYLSKSDYIRLANT